MQENRIKFLHFSYKFNIVLFFVVLKDIAFNSFLELEYKQTKHHDLAYEKQMCFELNYISYTRPFCITY